MTEITLFKTQFTLNRQHFEECYDQSQSYSSKSKIRWSYALCFLAGGIALLAYSEVERYISLFILGLGAIEIISGYFHRSWWLARQLLSRRANSNVDIEISSEGILSQTSYGNTLLPWADINHRANTEKGYLFVTKAGGQSYLSKSILSDETKTYIEDKTIEFASE